jgi:probable HAF family extracellular repeat protein
VAPAYEASVSGADALVAVAGTSANDLGTLGGNHSEAIGINAGGVIVGGSANAAGSTRAFRWTAAQGMKDLGVLIGTTSSRAFGINVNGQIVGESHTSSRSVQRGFRWTPAGGMKDLGSLGGGMTAAFGINDDGAVVGRSRTNGGRTHAFRWTPSDGMRDLGTLGGTFSEAHAINTQGDVIGCSTTPSNRWHAFIWKASTGMVDIDPTGTYSEAYGINRHGVVAGRRNNAAGQSRAFRWTAAAGIQELGTLGGNFSIAFGINDDGDIVGQSSTASGQLHAFVWTAASGMQDLGTLGGSLSLATGINSSGVIVGLSRNANSRVRATRWVTAVPLAVSAGGPYGGTEGSVIQLDGGATGGTGLTYHWDFGDGTTGTGPSQSHVYPDNGTYTATLTVRASNGLSGSDAATVRVTNAPPVVDAGPDVTVVVGRSFAQAGSFTDPGIADGPWEFDVVWGMGTSQSHGTATEQGLMFAKTARYQAVGTYTLKLMVTDKDRWTGNDERVITVVANQTPVANANGPYAGVEGSPVPFTSAGSGDGNDDDLRYRWDFGDGTTSTSASVGKRYADNGIYTVTLTVTDESDVSHSTTTTATITNAAPTGHLTMRSATGEDEPYVVTISGSDPGTADRPTLEFAIDCGKGSGYGAWTTAATTVTCPAPVDQIPSPITVRGKVRDKDGGETEVTRAITVNDREPEVTLVPTSSTTISVGQSVSFQGSFTDRGVADMPWETRIVWGDGSPSAIATTNTQGNLAPISHTYTQAGTFKTYLKVTDKDGNASYSAEITITVTP